MKVNFSPLLHWVTVSKIIYLIHINFFVEKPDSKPDNLILMTDMYWNALFFKKKLEKNTEKFTKTRKNVFFLNCLLFHTHTRSQGFRDIKSDLSKYFKNILRHFQKNWSKNIDKH